MTQNKSDVFESSAMPADWLKSMVGLWEGLPRLWFELSKNKPNEPGPEKGNGQNFKASADAALKSWQAVAAAVSAPESVHTALKSAGAMPDILLKLAQNTLGGFLQFQQKCVEHGNRLGKTAEAYKFENIDENLCRAWTEMYEKEFRQFFHIPQLGLTRTYQEKFNQALDKYNIYQATLSEFIRLLSLPMTQSMTVMQEKMSEMVETGNMPEESQVYYQMWIKILEGHYMTLFQSTDYIQTLGRTVNAISEFAMAKDAVFEDMLSVLPIPKRKEIDDLEREIYELKKRLSALEKKTP